MQDLLSLRLSVLLCTFFIYPNLIAQCPSGEISLSTQEQVDTFSIIYPDCSEIQGNLLVFGTSISNLNGLSSIESIDGDLRLTASQVTSLEGLNNLQTINGNFMMTSIAIENLEGLDNLTTVGGDFIIGNNNVLISLQGVPSISEIGGTLAIAENDLLPNLSGLENLITLNSILIQDNTSLINTLGLNNLITINTSLLSYGNTVMENFNGMNNLTSIGFRCIISNENLQSLQGLNSLETIDGNLSLYEMNSISNLDALENLNLVTGQIFLIDNTVLSNIDGLQFIDGTIIQNLTIQNNPALSTCAINSFCDYLSISSNEATISNNAEGCNTRNEIEAACLLGSEYHLKNQITLYPNPAQNKIFISDLEESTSIVIYDSMGRTVKFEIYTSSGINISGFQKGLYFIKVEKEGLISLTQFIKE